MERCGMGKRLLLVYSLLNAFLYFGITVAAPSSEAERLTELLTQSFDCLKSQEKTVRAILLESQSEKADRQAVHSATPWLLLAGVALVQLCWPRTRGSPHRRSTEREPAGS